MKKYDKDLLKTLADFGYPLVEPNVKMDPNYLLPQLVKTGDPRLLEGFPVVLANVLNRADLHFNEAKASEKLSPSDRRLFRGLYQVSCQLFMLYGLEFPNFKKKDMPHVEKFRTALVNDQSLDLERLKLDSKRLKQTFLRYVVQMGAAHSLAVEEKSKLREEFRQEFLLSLLLTPRQKELLYKKLAGNAFTKTEREYFSRVVKKKLQALADPDLHRLALKALQS